MTTTRTLNHQRGDLDAARLAAVGFCDAAADVFHRAAPYLKRGSTDMIPTVGRLDTYSPEFFCTARNFAGVGVRVAASLGGNGYSLSSARGGGAPGCWQSITRDLWPAPYLVMDTSASIAAYNHFELGRPLLTGHVWGRQLGEYTVNP